MRLAPIILNLNYKKFLMNTLNILEVINFFKNKCSHTLGPLENFPDSIFVEDPALAYKDNCILLRPGTQFRFGESIAFSKDIKNYFKKYYLLKMEKLKVEIFLE